MNLNYCNKCDYLIPFNELYAYKKCKHKYHMFECTNIEDIVFEEEYCSKCKQNNLKLNKLANIIKKSILKNIFPKIISFIKEKNINEIIKINGIYNSKCYKLKNITKYCYFCKKSYNNIDEIKHCMKCNKCINTQYYYHNHTKNICTHFIYKNKDYKRQYNEVIDELKFIPGGEGYKKAKKEFKQLSKK